MPGYISYDGALMPGIADALSEDRRGTLITIEVTAGAKTSSFPAGYNEWRKAIGCRVTAPAADGKANRAVISLIAETYDVPASRVTIQSGTTSSLKRVRVAGMDRKALLERLETS
jgi:uncharacterized protein (TIGR00251 family)